MSKKLTTAQKRYSRSRKKKAVERYKLIAKDYARLKSKDIDKGKILSLLMEKYNVSRQTVYNSVNVRNYRKTGNAGERPVRRA